MINIKGIGEISMNYQKFNGYEPVYDKESKMLIMGTVPSFDGIKNGFYYSSKKNYLYKLLGEIFDEKFYIYKNENNYTEIKKLLSKYHIAFYDIIKEGERISSNDDGIISSQNNSAKSINKILKSSNIKAIFVNSYETEKRLRKTYGGKKEMENKLSNLIPNRKIEVIRILSPSPNCARSGNTYDKVLENWKSKLK